MKTVIKIEDLGKQYRLGQVGTGTLSHDLNRFWHKLQGKSDPYLKIGEVNDRTVSGNRDLVWALKDINFEVHQGDVLGIIGNNGAGKSTLLKILSQITSPSVGEIKIKGRIAALLEVGTGFHPELTGRENIYLNGAILGMTKAEIKSKFDEIVDFSGVEKYIDTPVKRYSSGMLVRLAFAVAAHLEPEILVVDEVLAVGDIAFQNKCMGKMSEIGKQGRTILFVSHNMQAMRKLCSRGVLLKNGELLADCPIEDAIATYLDENISSNAVYLIDPPSDEQEIQGYIHKIQIEDLNGNPAKVIPVGSVWQIRISFKINKPIEHFIVGLNIADASDINVNTTWTDKCVIEKGEYDVVFRQDLIVLNPQLYNISVALSSFERSIQYLKNSATLNISDASIEKNTDFLRTRGVGVFLNQMNTIIIKK